MNPRKVNPVIAGRVKKFSVQNAQTEKNIQQKLIEERQRRTQEENEKLLGNRQDSKALNAQSTLTFTSIQEGTLMPLPSQQDEESTPLLQDNTQPNLSSVEGLKDLNSQPRDLNPQPSLSDIVKLDDSSDFQLNNASDVEDLVDPNSQPNTSNIVDDPVQVAIAIEQELNQIKNEKAKQQADEAAKREHDAAALRKQKEIEIQEEKKQVQLQFEKDQQQISSPHKQNELVNRKPSKLKIATAEIRGPWSTQSQPKPPIQPKPERPKKPKPKVANQKPDDLDKLLPISDVQNLSGSTTRIDQLDAKIKKLNTSVLGSAPTPLDEFVAKLTHLSWSLRTNLNANRDKLLAKKRKKPLTENEIQEILGKTASGRVLESTIELLQNLDNTNDQDAQLKLFSHYENRCKNSSGWKAFGQVIAAVVFAGIGFIVGAAIGVSAGALAGLPTGPGAFVTGAIGLGVGAVVGIGTGVATGLTLFHQPKIVRQAMEVKKSGENLVKNIPSMR